MTCSEGGNNLIVKHGIAPERDARDPGEGIPRIWASTANGYLEVIEALRSVKAWTIRALTRRPFPKHAHN